MRRHAGSIAASGLLLLSLAACDAPPRDAEPEAAPTATAQPAQSDVLFDPLDPLAPAGDADAIPPAAEAEAAEEAPEPLTLEQWNQRWTRLLARTVDPRTGAVDYARLQAERGTLHELRDSLAVERSFAGDEQRLAFLLNAYNLLVIATVVDEPQLPGTVRDIRGFFDEVQHDLLGETYTLDELRDQLIRPIGEPRAHFAMVNGAAGAPPLLHVAYSADELDAQLDYQLNRFLTDPVRNSVIGPTLVLSPIFRWFSDDFEAAADDGTVAGYLRERAPARSRIARAFARTDEPPIEYLDFNWALNYIRVPDRPVPDDDDE